MEASLLWQIGRIKRLKIKDKLEIYARPLVLIRHISYVTLRHTTMTILNILFGYMLHIRNEEIL